jgi:hypothetical protein
MKEVWGLRFVVCGSSIFSQGKAKERRGKGEPARRKQEARSKKPEARIPDRTP